MELKRKISSDKYSKRNIEKFNNAFPKTKTTLFGLIKMEAKQPDITYVSKYSPVVLADMTPSEINEYKYSNDIDTIYYNKPIDKPTEETAAEKAEAKSVLAVAASSTSEHESIQKTSLALTRDTYGLNGSGVKIGIIDEEYPNVSSEYLKNINITYKGKSTFESVHAETIITLIAGKNIVKGAVPNAKLFVTDRKHWTEEIEWLISKGVNVINMSNALGLLFSTSYNQYARWLDHVAIQHDIHVVIAVGNDTVNPRTTISQPAQGNNIITVGAFSTSTNEAETFSCYLPKATEGETQFKPDVSAPGDFVIKNDPNGRCTSYATPIVTGEVAQLCQINSDMKVRQDVVKSIVMAGAVKKLLNKSGTAIAMREKLGAGSIDAKASRYMANSGRYRGVKLVSGDNSYTTSFTVTSSDTQTRIGLAWLRNNRATNSTHIGEGSVDKADLARLTLKVKAPNGTTWTSNHPQGSIQLLSFEPPVTGKYTITVTRTTEKTSTTYFGLCWY